MKVRILLIVCFWCSIGYTQVGVNAKLPLHPLHVDAKGNNPSVGVLTTDDVKDDFVVTKDGNVGIGTVTPSAKLEVHGTMRINDGTQGENRILLSDKDGIGHWEKVPYDISTAVGSSTSLSKVIWNGTTTPNAYVPLNYSITLPKGRWVVSTGVVVNITDATDIWILAVLSSSNTVKQQQGFEFVSIAKANTAFAARLRPGKGFLSGSSVVNVTDNSVTLHVLLRKMSKWEFDPASPQNYFYAIPIL